MYNIKIQLKLRTFVLKILEDIINIIGEAEKMVSNIKNIKEFTSLKVSQLIKVSRVRSEILIIINLFLATCPIKHSFPGS